MSIEMREIPGLPSEKYRAGSDGCVYSKARRFSNRETTECGWYKLKTRIGRGGYSHVGFRRDGKGAHSTVHRLITLAFHGEQPIDKTQIRHLDGNRINNLPYNLCWGTAKENAADRVIHGTQTYGENHPNSKLTDKQREQIKAMWAHGYRQKEIAKLFGVAKSLVRYILGRFHCLHRPHVDHWATKFSQYDKETMLRMKDSGFNRDEIGEVFGAHPVHVSRIVKAIKGENNGN